MRYLATLAALIAGSTLGLLCGYFVMNKYIHPAFVFPTWQSPLGEERGPSSVATPGTILSVSPDGKSVVINARSPFESAKQILLQVQIANYTAFRDANGNHLPQGIAALAAGTTVVLSLRRGSGNLTAVSIVLARIST